MRYALFLLLFIAVGGGCTHAPMTRLPGTVTEVDSLHFWISKLTLPRIWHITYHDYGPGFDTTFYATDTFALVFNSDSAIAPFRPYCNDVLTINPHYVISSAITYITAGHNTFSSLIYYYRGDSVLYGTSSCNQGGMTWETSCFSTQ